MKRSVQLFICLVTVSCTSYAQPKTDQFLQNILSDTKDSIVREVTDHPDKYRLQIIYTRITRDKSNHARFRNYYFNVDKNVYFNPASTVKLPLALLSLEKLNEIKVKGVDLYTSMQFDSSYSGQKSLASDSTAETKLPSIAQFIRKAFLISDNDAYNRMYEFVGQQRINEALHKKGYEDIRITRQFMALTPEENRHTNQIRFVDERGRLIYQQAAAFNPDSFDFSHVIKLGNAFYDRNDSLIHEPMNFTKHNNLSLEDLQQMLQSVLFPESVAAQQRFNLTQTDRQFLLQYLSQYPSETSYPKYDTSEFYQSYVKFFFRDSTRPMPAGIRVFNKVGWAYGFLTDVSYVADFDRNVEFMLSATLYVNSDGILNDNKYDYDNIGWPFLRAMGSLVYNYALTHRPTVKPSLKEFKLVYGHRDPSDNRRSIKDVDN